MILPDHMIQKAVGKGTIGIEPYHARKQISHGLSYGLSSAGYDIRLSLSGIIEEADEGDVYVLEPGDFLLASSIERIRLPSGIIAFLKDKSTNARLGISVFNTVFEPGWEGYPTIEIANLSKNAFTLWHGQPIGQLIFHQLAEPTSTPYDGKYQNQPARPVAATMEI